MNTNTYEQLEQLYEVYAPGTLHDDIAFYMRNGFVHSSPEYFVMGQTFGRQCYVHAAVGVGALEKLLQHLPTEINQIGWERRSRGLRWYDRTKLNSAIRKLYGKTQKQISSTSRSCNGILQENAEGTKTTSPWRTTSTTESRSSR